MTGVRAYPMDKGSCVERMALHMKVTSTRENEKALAKKYFPTVTSSKGIGSRTRLKVEEG